jgi:repressor LexA
MNNDLTPKQQAILDFIQSSVEENHRSPSLREIGRHFDLSVGTVQDQVEAIRRKGFLEKESMISRGLKLAIGLGEIPILGRVHAGPLHAALENVEGHLPASRGMSPSMHFALKVRGDSMIDAGILEGDRIIVRMQPVANEGDIVVARVDDETTVKRFRTRNGKKTLEPANPRYRPIVDTPFEIIGVVVELRRNYK